MSWWRSYTCEIVHSAQGTPWKQILCKMFDLFKARWMLTESVRESTLKRRIINRGNTRQKDVSMAIRKKGWKSTNHKHERQRGWITAPCVVRRTFSALLGKPSQDGVWVSGSISTQCMNSSRLQNKNMLLILKVIIKGIERGKPLKVF